MFLLLLGVFFLFTPKKPVANKPNYQEILWEEEKARARRESEAEKNREWFSEKRWLSNKEIDWALERMEKNDKFKVLPAHQFYLAKEAKRENDKFIFQELLNQINDKSKELVFIPVNNPNFHWSLLVYKVKEKKFWHWDTLGGANWGYVRPLVRELLENIHGKEVELGKYLVKKHDIRQENGYDCGIGVIAIIGRIRELWNQSWLEWVKYGSFKLENDLGKFNFPEEREELRERYLKEVGDE